LVRWEVVKLTQPRKKAFRVNRTYPKIVRNRKHRIAHRLDPNRGWSDQPEPMMSACNIHFEMAERGRARNGFLTRPPVEILRAALIKTLC
jgi:hypothetical protein